MRKMGKIFCVIGKSSSGKDTIYESLLEDKSLELNRIIPYTTRPIRDGEEEGREYHFCTEDDVQKLDAAGKIVEMRQYHTVYGL
jgi:guanylate kinase